jgi:hypothetical protein
MSSKTRKMGKILVLLLLISFLVTVGMISIFHVKSLPAGIARVYGRSVYTVGTGEDPIRRAKVELWEDAFIDTRIAISETDDTGYYEFNIAITGSKNVYAKIYCESYIAYVTHGVYGYTYSYKTSTQIAYEGGTISLGIYTVPPEDLYWRAMDYAIDEWLWMLREVNWVQPQVEIKYPKGNWPQSFGNIIELPDRDVENWDRTTVLHEYAHCVMYALYNGSPPQGNCSDFCQCGNHHYYNSVSDAEFAFYEGWADFMQSAVDNKPSNLYLQDLGDVDGNGIPNDIATNIEDNTYPVKDVYGTVLYWRKWYHGRCPYKPLCPNCPSFNNNGNTVEGAVAGIFWDIYDPVNDDHIHEDIDRIWYVLSIYKPKTMMEFVDYWPYQSVEKELCTVCRDHGITIFDDLNYLFYDNTFFVAGDQAYCTDVLGSAKTSFGLAKGGARDNPEGRTDTILTTPEYNTKNLIMVGGPAVSPVADAFDNTFGITYNYNPGVSFEILYHDKSIYVNVNQYPSQDICIVFLGEDNARSVLLVWGYGWEGTYAGSVFIGDPNNWSIYQKANMVMLRWIDSNGDQLVQKNEVYVEQSISLDRNYQTQPVPVQSAAPPLIKPDAFGSLGWLFYSNTFFVAGDQAYCTDVLGSAKIAFGLAKGGARDNPDGRTDTILTTTEYNTGNLIMVGGPAVNPVADAFDNTFGITYNYQPGVSFEIFCEGESIHLDLNQYPHQDICIVYLGTHNTRTIMLVWGYGWEGTYTGSFLMGDPNTWQIYSSYHLLMLRWIDFNADGLVQKNEIFIEKMK